MWLCISPCKHSSPLSVQSSFFFFFFLSVTAWPTRELFVWLILTHSWASRLNTFQPPLNLGVERDFICNTPFQLRSLTPTLSALTFAKISSNYFPWQQTAFLGRLIVGSFFQCLLFISPLYLKEIYKRCLHVENSPWLCGRFIHFHLYYQIHTTELA